MGVITADLLVIGGGLAGRRCAQEAGKHADVLLICDGAGASPFIHGLNVPLLPEDSVDCYLQDTLQSGSFQNDPALAGILCEGSLALKEEFAFDRKEDGQYQLIRPLGSTWPRVASIQNHTGAIILQEMQSSRNYREENHVRAMKLLTADGRVCGAECFDTRERRWFTIHARAVVLACGGFGNIFRLSTNTADIGGDGIAMALDAGAELCDMEFIQYEPTTAIWPAQVRGKGVITTMLYEGAVIRNGKGERFMDEKVNKDQLAAGIFREIARGNTSPHGGVWYDMTQVSAEKMHSVYEPYYQRYRAAGIDITREMVEIMPAPHTTMGGVRIHTDMMTTLEGLFACGEITGGLHGANRLGGNAGTEVLVMGKRAGEKAAEYLRSRSSQPLDRGLDDTLAEADLPYDASEARKILQDMLQRCAQVIRSEALLMEGLRTVNALLVSLRDCDHCFEKMRMYHDALTARELLAAALARKETLGSHIREDRLSV